MCGEGLFGSTRRYFVPWFKCQMPSSTCQISSSKCQVQRSKCRGVNAEFRQVPSSGKCHVAEYSAVVSVVTGRSESHAAPLATRDSSPATHACPIAHNPFRVRLERGAEGGYIRSARTSSCVRSNAPQSHVSRAAAAKPTNSNMMLTTCFLQLFRPALLLLFLSAASVVHAQSWVWQRSAGGARDSS